MAEPPSGVERAAASGYAVGAASYRRGRPSYPAEVIDEIVAEAGGGRVLDLGAGTGAMTELLLAQDVEVVAADPVRAMLDQIERPVPSVVAAAQALPVRRASCTAVVVANAFHWFASVEALHQIRHCLTDRGLLALVWNDRDQSLPWVRQHTALVDRHEGTAPRFKSMVWKSVVDDNETFEQIGYIERPNPTPMTRDRLVDRTLSTSFIAALDPPLKASVKTEAEELAASLPEAFDYPYTCRLWLYRPRRI